MKLEAVWRVRGSNTGISEESACLLAGLCVTELQAGLYSSNNLDNFLRIIKYLFEGNGYQHLLSNCFHQMGFI